MDEVVLNPNALEAAGPEGHSGPVGPMSALRQKRSFVSILFADMRRWTNIHRVIEGAAVKAECQCGQLAVELPERPLITIACHCLDCQRRTGAPFGVLAYYRRDQISIRGEAKPYRRASANGNAFDTFFCPNCGSTVYVKLAKQPELLGIAVGTIGNRAFPAPTWSVWEQSKHHWVELPDDVKHFAQGN